MEPHKQNEKGNDGNAAKDAASLKPVTDGLEGAPVTPFKTYLEAIEQRENKLPDKNNPEEALQGEDRFPDPLEHEADLHSEYEPLPNDPADLAFTVEEEASREVITAMEFALEEHPLFGVLPPQVLSLVTHQMNCRGINPEMSIAGFLSAAAAAMSPGVKIELNEYEEIPLNLFFCVASSVGSGKSSVKSAFSKGIQEFQDEKIDGNGRWADEYFVQSDVSEAGLVEALYENCYSSIYLVEDEAREFLDDLSNRQGRKVRTLITKAFHREAYSRKRKNDVVHFDSIGLDVLLMAQHDSVYQFASSPLVIRSGMYARFLFVDCRPVHPHPEAPGEDYDPANEELIRRSIRALCELFRTRDRPADKCSTLGLCGDGGAFIDAIRRREAGTQEKFPASFFQRTIHQTVRIAGVLAVVHSMLDAGAKKDGFNVPEVLDIRFLEASYRYVLARNSEAACMQLRGRSELFELITILAQSGGSMTLSQLKEHGLSPTRIDTLVNRHGDFVSKSLGHSKKQGGRPPWIVRLKPGVVDLLAGSIG